VNLEALIFLLSLCHQLSQKEKKDVDLELSQLITHHHRHHCPT
jgi:hypothetical protein